ncbi:MAG: SCO family protein [Caulobacteraceae bacterium]
MGPSAPPAAAGSGTALVGGPFQLVDQNGKPVTEAVLKGKWSLVFFGFTSCPDVCPTTLSALGQAIDQLGPKAANLQVVLISVDPERDTPAQMKTYLTTPGFPPNIIGLTGTVAQSDAAARAYRVFHEKQATGDTYTVNHSTAIYLMDPKGRFNRVLSYGLTPEELVRQISDAMRGS